MKTRGRSVPATAFPTGSGGKNNSNAAATAIIRSPSSIPPIASNGSVVTSRNSPRLLSHADALARMTIELNVRAVSAQTERLEKSLSALMTCTQEDKAFRESHDARLQRMRQEILVVKQRMEEIQGPEWGANGKMGPGSRKKDVDESIEQLRKEVGELRGLVGDISSTLDKLPTAAEAEALMSRVRLPACTAKGRRPGSARSHATAKQRIEDAIRSTRRWNGDHKITQLNDAAFTANYLRQQSKRDPQMAVHIQKAIQRRVYRSGRPRARNRPESLEQLCRDVGWKDVIETAEDVLVRNRDRTAKTLEQQTR
ncbi:hypothetical protein Trco_002028 [Trichoderma cornu-damae]|uniref:Uncharacterized protein n=1 Tax=Trichoderma cornu-damae TaxID=654480 RepID=A0A9P8QU98_9HYPO|nr:hypothetical protein Trco_002028 [Trichoderma cornu-damae]